jgi:hypothetical protein
VLLSQLRREPALMLSPTCGLSRVPAVAGRTVRQPGVQPGSTPWVVRNFRTVAHGLGQSL